MRVVRRSRPFPPSVADPSAGGGKGRLRLTNMRAQHHWIITEARKMAVRWWLIMAGELFLLAWILDATLAEGGRVKWGGIWDIISLRQLRRFT